MDLARRVGETDFTECVGSVDPVHRKEVQSNVELVWKCNRGELR